MVRVLQLATSPRSFFEQQVETLEAQGVECTTLTVPRAADGSRSPKEYLRYEARVLEAVATEEFDLVHANYGLTAPFAFAQPVRPVVLTLWGSDVMGEAGWLKAISRAAATRSDAVIAPSEPVARGVDVPTNRIPFGVDTDRFRPVDRDAARAELGWETDGPVVLFPYPPSREVKNYPLAESVVESLPVAADLRTMSGVPHERVPLYMNASDAVLVTSKRESGPMVVKEAAACNVPVVASDVGFVREVLSDVSRSHVCETEAEFVDALASVLRDGRRADGRDRIDGLGLERMGERIREVYAAVLDRNCPPDARVDRASEPRG